MPSSQGTVTTSALQSYCPAARRFCDSSKSLMMKHWVGTPVPLETPQTFFYFDKEVLSSADDYDVLLSLEATAAHTQGWMELATINGRAFHLYAESLFQELSCVHSSACEKYSLTLNDFRLN